MIILARLWLQLEKADPFTTIESLYPMAHLRTALGFKPPDKYIMKKAPRRSDDILISPWILFRYLILPISSILASNLVKVTAVVGLWGWTTVTLSIASLLMVIRCSSKDPGYVNMSGGIKNNVDAEVCFLSD
ncbi:unnamed protein product [Lactuca virosa]|uniref:Uncharacterized protein n=1 Tax=Lactuca virosa TaxID=75947 RepID=A0AAU9LLU0_9ASTR|nr:unnamed protein product [Lactuca virosa]